MEYLTLNNGVPMPLIGFGTFMLGGETCTEAVTAAIESGYRMIDTAEAYGNEKEVGEGMRLDLRRMPVNLSMLLRRCGSWRSS